MLRKLLYAGLTFAAIGAAIASAVVLRAHEDAQALAREAELVMRAPLVRVPELSKLDAVRARKLLEQATTIHNTPRSASLLAWAEALEEYQKGRPEQASRALARATRALPENADLQTLAAAIALQAGDPKQAAAAVTKALSIDPKHARARMLAADLALDAGQAQRAYDGLQALLQEQPELAVLHNRLGLVNEALGHPDAALAEFERAVTFDPSLPSPHINLGRLLRDQGRVRDAERAFALAIERSPSEGEAWLGRGLTRVALGDLEGGRSDIQQARQLEPAEPAPLVALADLDAWHGQLDQAIERYRAALVLSSHDALAWLKLGNALTRTRAYGEARTSFEHALTLQPNLAAAYNGLGAVQMGQGDRDAAEQAFTKAAALDSRDPNPLRNLALLHKRESSVRGVNRGRTAIRLN
jgi:Tfp pilus assembly protein PilF